MTSRSIRYRPGESANMWPGFVDVLATLLIVIIFVLMIFTVSQIYLSDAISGRDKALENLRSQIDELSKILVLESQEKQAIEKDLSKKESLLKTEQELNLQLEADISENLETISTQEINISLLSGKIDELLIELKIVAKALETYEGLDIASLNTEGLGERINKALATRIEQLNSLNIKLAQSQKETSEQLEIVKKLNDNLIAINNSLGLEDANLSEQLQAISDKNNELVLANQEIINKNNELELSSQEIINKNNELILANKELEFSQKQLLVNEEKLKDQIIQYQELTEELIALNESLDLKDKTLLEQLDLIKTKNIKLSQLNENLIRKDKTISDLRGKIFELNNILSLNQEKQILQKVEISELNKKLTLLELDEAASSKKLVQEQQVFSDTLEQVNYLSGEIDNLKKEIAILNSALEASEMNILTKELEIEILGERLNKALTSKVFELQKYRSEFFGKLQSILGDREDIKIVGDRFIFESELLFDSGSANLQLEGKEKLEQIGITLKETTTEIPNNIDWIIQVEGHTDKRPIQTIQYPSNWELSTARANSVLKLLLELGFPPNRLSAAGYGEFYPISLGDTPKDLQQNRRIELKLTSR